MIKAFFIYAIFATFFARRATFLEAVFFGIVLPAAFMILLSAARVAAIAAALSPDSMAFNAFFVAVLTALRRAVLIAFFFAVTKILLSHDLWLATLFSFYFYQVYAILKKTNIKSRKNNMLYVISIMISYLLGTIPFGVVMTKLFHKGDLRKIGSGNIGAANAMRAGGFRVAALVWLFDMLKAIIAVLIGRYVGGDVFAVWCGFVAVFGHCYPIWLKFHGGKGVSTLFGVLLAVNPLLFVFCGIEWLLVSLPSKHSSAGAMIVFLLMPVFGFCISSGVGIGFLAISLLCLFRHRENIVRLINGNESVLDWRWKK